jgi:hypothetical protein
MGGGEIRVVHAIPGRIRLKVSRLRGNPASAAEIEVRLSALDGVDRVTASPTTGSVVVTYGVASPRSADIAPELSEAFRKTLFQGTDSEELRRQLSKHGNGSPESTPLARRVQGLLGSIDRGVERVSHGAVDLRVIVSVTLLCVGLGIVATSGTIPMPTWYDFVWAGFATFAALSQMSERAATPATGTA